MKPFLFTLIKLPIKLLIDCNFCLTLSPEEEQTYVVNQGDSLLFDQIRRLRGHFSPHISEMILVTARKNPRQEEDLRHLLEDGFTYQGLHYSRFGKSASQSKDGITAFVCDAIWEPLYQATQLGLEVKECVISKYEAQRCLVFSSCTLLEEKLPNIVMIGEYEKILKHQHVCCAVLRQKEITDETTGEQKTITMREIEEGFHDIRLSPFDGCGCHELDFARTISQALGLDYTAVGSQIRLPFMKGYSVYVPFRQFFREAGITQIQDVYGRWHPVDTIDCIWNTSMFKGHSLFQKAYGNDAWDAYIDALNRFQYKLGISKYSHHLNDIPIKARMNFQYLQCLDLWDPDYIDHFYHRKEIDLLAEDYPGKIVRLARYTTRLYQQIIKGDLFYTLQFLGIADTKDWEPVGNYLQAILCNPVMQKDPAIRQFLHRKLKKHINQAKLGKIYANGFYHTVVGDMVAYLQYAAAMEPIGCLKAGEFFAHTIPEGPVLSFRSPLVDPSEVNAVRLVSNPLTDRWLSQFHNQDVVMINLYDLTMPQQGGMDADGDAVFLTDDPMLFASRIAKPIVVDMDDKATTVVASYDRESIVRYELMTRDSRIGEITNVATSIANQYTTNDEIYRRYQDLTSLLRLFQGKEIDYLKTGFRWHMNAGLRKHLKQLPWFLLHNYPDKLELYEKVQAKNNDIQDPAQKLPSNGYRSPSPMNELCDYVTAWEKKCLIWDRSSADTSWLLLNHSLPLDDTSILRQVRHLLNEFGDRFRETVRQLEHAGNEGDYGELDALTALYKTRLQAIDGITTEELLANYVIKVSYRNRSISKHMAWFAYGDYLLKNLETNSPEQPRLMITPVPKDYPGSQEYLGRYYILTQEKEAQNHV